MASSGGMASAIPREADNVGEQNRDGLPADRSERFVLRSQQLNDVRRKVARQIVARPLGRDAQTIDLTQLGDVGQRLADGDFEIAQIHRLGDKIKGAAIHRRAQIRHVAIGRDDDRPHRRLPLAQFAKQGEPIHHRHVDVEQHQVDIRLGGERD